MSLAALSHQKWATVTVTTATAIGILDHIYTAITQANDYAATAIASPLTGVTKYQNAGNTEAVYGAFGYGSALTPKFLIAGVNAARTPLMAASTQGSHTYTSNVLMAGLTVSAGAFASWDHASQPFTSGRPIGLCKYFNVGALTASKIHAYVTAETLWVFIEDSANGVWGFTLGAHLDPDSTDASDAETDGRVYSVIASGTAAAIASTMHSSTATVFPGHQATATNAHHLSLIPGSATCAPTNRLDCMIQSTTTAMITRSSRPGRKTQLFRDTTADRLVGRWREVEVVRDSKLGLTQAPAGVDAWHYVGGSATADVDCFGLRT